MAMTDLGAGPDAWRRFVGALLESPDEQTPFTLARIALLTDATFETPHATLVPGLPGGRPNRSLTRQAAAALLTYGHDTDPVSATWRFLGLQQQFRYQKDPQPGEADEHPDVLAAVEEAIRVGAALGPDAHGWAHIRHARTLRDAHRDLDARAAADRAITVLTEAGPAPDGPFSLLVTAIGGDPWFFDHPAARQYLLLKAHSRAAIGSRMLRDYERAITERDRQINVARTLQAQRPALLIGALGQRAQLARSVGDVETSLRLLDEQEEVARADGSRAARVRYLLSAASAARFLDDWDSDLRLRRRRIAARIEPFTTTAVTIEPDPLLNVVDDLEAAGQQAALIGIGNDAYEIARDLIDSGQAEVDPSQLDVACRWLDVAERAWRDIALNGQVAIDFRRVQIDALRGEAGDPAAVGRRMVDLSRAWRRASGKRRSAIVAARHGASGDPMTLERLTELLNGAPAVDAAHLRVGAAQWHLSYGHALAAQGQLERAQEAFTRADYDAATAASGLTVDRIDSPPVLLDPDAVIEGYRIRAEALRSRRAAGATSAETSAAAELAVRGASLSAVAQRFIACGTPRQRQILDRRYGSWLVNTLMLAATVGDLDTTDRTAEVMRRDLAGSVLVAIADDDLAPAQIALLARQLTAALAARPMFDTDEPPGAAATTSSPSGDDDEPEEEVSPQRRARGIATQIDQTLDVIGGVLGPVARSLFDPRTVLQHTTRGAAERLYPDRPGVVLSLILLSNDSGQPFVCRRMSWRPTATDDQHDHLDVVPAPRWLPGLAINDDSHAFFARVATLTDVLLPAPLIDLLNKTTPDAPIPVTVVPTGLLAVPFAALPIGEHLLLDLAVISVVQSLQAVDTLTRPGNVSSVTPLEVGVYDTVRLKHARYEWEELRRHRPAVQDASSLRELTELLANPWSRGGPGILALAIHGIRGADGWTQAKQLPSGETLTSGHVLQWSIPALVVGASCDTDIRADAGGELGGFPLAFQLRGAVNIIGSLHAIDDKATAQIMARFHAATVHGAGAAAGLRQAQRGWIAVDRARRLSMADRWAYLLSYGLAT